MMRSVLSGRPVMAQPRPFARGRKTCSRRLEARVEGLERRNLMAGGSVVQSGGLVTVTPAPTGPNTAIVSYQNVGGTTMLDVNLNGSDNYFSLAQVGFVYYMGTGVSGNQTFENETSLHTVAWGGSGSNLFVSTSGADEFFGGSGNNTFVAGTGYDVLVAGNGGNVFDENAAGSGFILEGGSSDTINAPAGASANYIVI
jgi:Ca2+-binding RTX toxin-like protein